MVASFPLMPPLLPPRLDDGTLAKFVGSSKAEVSAAKEGSDFEGSGSGSLRFPHQLMVST